MTLALRQAIRSNLPRRAVEKVSRLSAAIHGGPRREHLRHVAPRSAGINGHFDHLSQRFDLETRQVVDYIPPQPDADHEWIPGSKRWRKRADVAEREQRRKEAQMQIEALELKQLRRVLEVLAESDPRIKTVVGEIAQLRAELK